ncbi:hypothetical protein LINGRAHAP2_LOCUS9357, partial [Linum grandiflorum]
VYSGSGPCSTLPLLGISHRSLCYQVSPCSYQPLHRVFFPKRFVGNRHGSYRHLLSPLRLNCSDTMDPIPPSIITSSYVVQFSADDVGDDRIRFDLSLIGRIFWPLEPKPSLSVLHALARQWRIPPEDLQIFDVGHCLTQFVFPSLKDKERIFQTQPWAFKTAIINLME